MQNHYDVIVGCDPEFMIKIHDKVVPTWVFKDGGRTALFGRENDDVFELRPAPSTSVIQLVARIRTALEDAVRHYPFLKKATWISCPFHEGQPLGGHIHISTNPNIQLFNTVGYGMYATTLHPTMDLTTIGRNLMYNLDAVEYKGVRNCISNRNYEKRRREFGYGERMDIRLKRDGSTTIIEYRTISTWLYSPVMAFLYLIGAQIAVYSTVYGVSLKIPKLRGRSLLWEIVERVSKLPIADTPDFKILIEHLKQLRPNNNLNMDKNFLKNWGVI